MGRDKEKQINWDDERYHPFSTRDVPQPPAEALRPPRPTSVPHYNEWAKCSPQAMDRLLIAARCQFMDMRQGALSGTVFLSVNKLTFIMEDRLEPDRDIYRAYTWKDVAGFAFGMKEGLPTHPFYRVNTVMTLAQANSLRIVTENKKKKGQFYIHNITSIPAHQFASVAAMLDAVFRLHHQLPRPTGYELVSPPQVDAEEVQATGQGGVVQSTTQSMAASTQSTLQSTVPGVKPGMSSVAAPPNPAIASQNPAMTQSAAMMPQNSQAMPQNPQMQMMQMIQQMQQMIQNPLLLPQILQNPVMMQQIMQNPMMLQTLMQQLTLNPMLRQQLMMQNPMLMQQLMMMSQTQQQQMMMMQNTQLRKQLMTTQVPSSAANTNEPNQPNLAATVQSPMQGFNQTQMQPPSQLQPPTQLQQTQFQHQQPSGVVAPSMPQHQQQIVQNPEPSKTGSPTKQERAATEDDEFFAKKNEPKRYAPFKLTALNMSIHDEWSKRLPSIPTFEWKESPIRLIALGPENEVRAEEVLNTMGGKSVIEFTESMKDPSVVTDYNLTFGYPGAQVPVEQELKQKVILATPEAQKFCFRVIKRKYPKYRFNAEPLEGTIGKQGGVELLLQLKMLCTTSVELEIPIVFWQGTLKDFDKMMGPERPPDKQVFVSYFRGKIQSQLSTRLDIEEVLLYKPAIGNGAFGTVYKGRYRGLDVACKLLKDQDDLTQEMFDDFRSEVQMFETLRHPCIVNFVGAVFFPGSLALVTELCQYGSLPSAMQKYGPKIWNTQMKIKALFDCARAMDFLHQSSIIHRDLKPDNLLATSLEVHSPAVCKLSDFGTTKGANSMMRDMKMTKGIGTPLYMAPEMMRGTEGYTTKADIYSFGIMMASIIDDGKEPYEGDTRIESSWQFTNQVIGGLRPNVANQANMPPELVALMMRCWDASPAARPSFDQIVVELEAMLAE